MRTVAGIMTEDEEQQGQVIDDKDECESTTQNNIGDEGIESNRDKGVKDEVVRIRVENKDKVSSDNECQGGNDK